MTAFIGFADFLNPEPRLPAVAGTLNPLIKLTRLTGECFILNAELIRYVESLPDTYVTLTTGDRIVVRETMDDVALRAVEYQRSKWLVPPPARRAG